MTLIAGAITLAFLLYLFHLWTKADPKALARRLMQFGGVAAILGAIGLLVTGRFMAAAGLAGVGFALLGRAGGGLGALFGGGPPRVSKVRSPWFEMALDHGTGALTGTVIAGPQAGTPLDALDVEMLIGMRPVLDAQSLALIEAYLDRRAPAWRQNGQDDAGRRQGSSNGPGSGPMTEQEAYDVLGLEAGADEAAVRQAHRTLMKKLHPDHGGSVYLAARVNQAKDIILRKHR